MAHLLGQGPQLPAGSYSISIHPPSTGEGDGSESDEVPSPPPSPFPTSQPCGTARLRPPAAPFAAEHPHGASTHP